MTKAVNQFHVRMRNICCFDQIVKKIELQEGWKNTATCNKLNYTKRQPDAGFG
jgi:hypothetical protein